jgi:hypothetical protein
MEERDKVSTRQMISDLKSCDNGYDWNKFIPSKEVRKIIFKAYVSSFPIALLDHSFVKRHAHLNANDSTSDDDFCCKGCWNCCAPHPEISYDEYFDYKDKKKTKKRKSKKRKSKKSNVDENEDKDEDEDENEDEDEDDRIDRKSTQNNIDEISVMIKKALHYGEQKDEKNMIKYYDMVIEKGRHDLSIAVVNYYYSPDMSQKSFKKHKDTINKYFDIFIDNFDLEKYSGCCLNRAITTFGPLSMNLYDIGDYDSMKKIALFGTEQFNNKYCHGVLGRYYKVIEKNYDKMKFYLWTLIDRGDRIYIKCRDACDDDECNEYNECDHCTEKIVFERAFENLRDYYFKKEINYEKFEKLIFFATMNLDDDIGRIFDLIKYYNNKCRKNKKLQKKGEYDILYDFSNFLINEMQNKTECKNKKRIVEFLIKHCGNELNFVPAIHLLGEYYQEQGDCRLMKKYYMMAIEKENYEESLFNLAFYYETEEENNDLAFKYYKICFEKHRCQESFDNMIEILYNEKRYDELLIYVDVAKSSERYVHTLLKIGDCYCKKRDYANMLECYSHISKTDISNLRIHDIAKIKIAKYYETIGRDYEKAKENYELVLKKNRAQKYINNFEKKYFIYEKICKNKINEKADCCICCAEKNIFIKMECCSNMICVNCVVGVIDKTLKCPFCRREYYGDCDYDDDDIVVSDDDTEQNHFINGIYYEDEVDDDEDVDADADDDGNEN